jgi:hypothetical protein
LRVRFGNYDDFTFGAIRSDDAYKGGAGPADVANWHPLELYNTITPDNGNLAMWVLFIPKYPDAIKPCGTQRLQMQMLAHTYWGNAFSQGHYMFILKRCLNIRFILMKQYHLMI